MIGILQKVKHREAKKKTVQVDSTGGCWICVQTWQFLRLLFCFDVLWPMEHWEALVSGKSCVEKDNALSDIRNMEPSPISLACTLVRFWD